MERAYCNFLADPSPWICYHISCSIPNRVFWVIFTVIRIIYCSILQSCLIISSMWILQWVTYACVCALKLCASVKNNFAVVLLFPPPIQNPSYTYNSLGTYSITITLKNYNLTREFSYFLELRINYNLTRRVFIFLEMGILGFLCMLESWVFSR